MKTRTRAAVSLKNVGGGGEPCRQPLSEGQTVLSACWALTWEDNSVIGCRPTGLDACRGSRNTGPTPL